MKHTAVASFDYKEMYHLCERIHSEMNAVLVHLHENSERMLPNEEAEAFTEKLEEMAASFGSDSVDFTDHIYGLTTEANEAVADCVYCEEDDDSTQLIVHRSFNHRHDSA